MSYQCVEQLNVIWHHHGANMPLGQIVLKDRQILFKYHAAFLDTGIEVSPFKLPLKSGAFMCDDRLFEGMFGLFDDSLPDGWGRLLLDRQVEKYGIHRMQLTPLDRLAYVGQHGMGALEYAPALSEFEIPKGKIVLDEIARDSRVILAGEGEDVLEELLLLNGSSSGARPKIVVGVDALKKRIVHGVQDLPEKFSHCIIKFASASDLKDAGAIEYAYNLMAQDAGIVVPETHLFTTKSGGGYFGVKRFDRDGNQPVHMHSLCGLIHADYRAPSLDYEMVLRVTQTLTKNMAEVEKAFRLACFNVLAHNRDDHSKNFSYILKQDHEWAFSPAYDLNFSYGPGGEQSMLVMGEGRNPQKEHLLQLGAKFDLKNKEQMIEQVQEAVANFGHYAARSGVSEQSQRSIIKHL